jgi:hypothetical protein
MDPFCHLLRQPEFTLKNRNGVPHPAAHHFYSVPKGARGYRPADRRPNHSFGRSVGHPRPCRGTFGAGTMPRYPAGQGSRRRTARRRFRVGSWWDLCAQIGAPCDLYSCVFGQNAVDRLDPERIRRPDKRGQPRLVQDEPFVSALGDFLCSVSV